MKQNGFKERSVVSVRAVLGVGTYWIEVKADSFENTNVDFDAKQNFCETYQLSLSVSSTKSAIQPYFQSESEEYCLGTTSMP